METLDWEVPQQALGCVLGCPSDRAVAQIIPPPQPHFNPHLPLVTPPKCQEFSQQ